MSSTLTRVATKAKHNGVWLFAAAEAEDQGRPMSWLAPRRALLQLAAKRAAA